MDKKNPISRLVELKAQEIDELRKDFERLEQLVNDSQAHLDVAIEGRENFSKKVYSMEGEGEVLDAGSMLEHRKFLNLLDQKIKDAEFTLQDIGKQRDLAHEGLKQAFIEKKTFELIGKRRDAASLSIKNRRQLTETDDAELIRLVKAG